MQESWNAVSTATCVAKGLLGEFVERVVEELTDTNQTFTPFEWVVIPFIACMIPILFIGFFYVYHQIRPDRYDEREDKNRTRLCLTASGLILIRTFTMWWIFNLKMIYLEWKEWDNIRPVACIVLCVLGVGILASYVMFYMESRETIGRLTGVYLSESGLVRFYAVVILSGFMIMHTYQDGQLNLVAKAPGIGLVGWYVYYFYYPDTPHLYTRAPQNNETPQVELDEPVALKSLPTKPPMGTKAPRRVIRLHFYGFSDATPIRLPLLLAEELCHPKRTVAEAIHFLEPYFQPGKNIVLLDSKGKKKEYKDFLFETLYQTDIYYTMDVAPPKDGQFQELIQEFLVTHSIPFNNVHVLTDEHGGIISNPNYYYTLVVTKDESYKPPAHFTYRNYTLPVRNILGQ